MQKLFLRTLVALRRETGQICTLDCEAIYDYSRRGGGGGGGGENVT